MAEYKMDLGGALAVAIDGLNKILNRGVAGDLKQLTAEGSGANKEFTRPETLEEARLQIFKVEEILHKWTDAIEDLATTMSGEALVNVRTLLQSEWELAKSNSSAEANETLYKNLIGQLPYPADESEDKPENLDDK